MEKEVKIIPPEGYEIDKENSTLECIKFKPKASDVKKNVITNLCFASDSGNRASLLNDKPAFFIYQSEEQGAGWAET